MPKQRIKGEFESAIPRHELRETHLGVRRRRKPAASVVERLQHAYDMAMRRKKQAT
jgi:hypothetical protein